MKRTILFLTFFVAMLVSSLATNLPTAPFRNITVEDGLLANGVRNIVQDHYGFIWFGTDNGLCRYDGTHIQPFRIMENGANQFISALLADTDGLYVGTDNGVFFFHFQSEKFQRRAADIRNTVRAFSLDKDGNVWISLNGQSVFRYNPKNKQLKKYTVFANDSSSSVSMTIVYADAQNRIWAVGGSGEWVMCQLNKAKDLFEPVRLKSSSPDLGAYAMLQTKDGSLWLGTWNNGLVRINDDFTISQVINPLITGVGNHIHCLYEWSPTQLLIGCDGGLICFNPQDGSWKMVSYNRSAPSSISNRFVYTVMGDHEGGLWYGTFYGGVNYLSPVADRFEAYSAGNGLHNGLHGNVISRFCEDNAGHVWVASDDGGLSCFRQSDRQFVDFPHSDVLSKYNIHALCVDGDYLWIGTYSDGIIQLNVRSGKMRHYDMENEFASPSAYALFMDSSRTLWVGTMDAIYRYDAAKDKFVLIHNIGALVIDIDQDAHGDIWASTHGKGIFCYRPSTGKKWFHQLPCNQVECLYIDSHQKIWVATTDGLYAYQSMKFLPVPLDIPTTDFCAIIEEGGALWLSTTKGLVRYVPGEPVQLYNCQDGLVSEQFQPNSVLKTSDGKLFFGTVRGFNAFYPYQIHVNQSEPSVFITGLKLYNKTIEVGSDVLPEALQHIPQVDLSYQDDMFSLSFAALSYCSPEKNQYAYLLEGFDKDWNYVGARHEATYTNIPSGTYTFRVKATNNDGIWSSRDATLKIVVHPPFWLTLPAKIIYLLLALAAIWLYTQFRLRKAERRHQLELVRLNEKKEAEVRDARLRFFTMIAHEIRTPVSLIIGPLEKVKQSFTQHELSNDLEVVDRNAHRLLELVNQLLDFNKVQQADLQLHFSLQNMGRLLRAVTDRFVPTLQQKNAVLQVNEPPADFTAVVDEEAITKVISNLMTNATKYTKDHVCVSCVVDADHQHFHIIVEDNGMGVSAAEQKKIFNPFYQSRDNKPGTGIGLSIVKNIVDLHHGTVRVESEEGRGAKFVVSLPVHQKDVEIVQEPAKNDVASDVAMVQNDDAVGDTSSVNAQRPEVLIVEDNEDMLHFLSNHFKKEYTVLTAQNGVQGLKQLKTHSVTLIVSDWMMPEMDGAEFCKQVRADQSISHLPIILLTAKTDSDSKALGMDVGADAYIEKPFSMKHLEATIRNLMEMRRLLLAKFSQNSSEKITQMAKSPVDNVFLVKLNKLIEDNMCNTQLSVPFIANEMGISRSGLFAKLKALTGATPNEMIQIVRLRKAAELMKDGGYRINEICYMVGFSSPSYFSKCFQQQFGMKPGEYAKRAL